ncbi:hypothetical protein EON65_09820 [archaeon]|nr:MAG: hypothetical protein EON65_09820 [archaeon]
MNLKDSIKHCKAAHEVSSSHDADYRPISTDHLITLQDISDHPEMRQLGIMAIQSNEVAAIIMSGGQGTRLGFHGPKGESSVYAYTPSPPMTPTPYQLIPPPHVGMYDIGLVSHKSIFQLHVEKLLKLISLYTSPSSPPPHIPLYVMTSDLNHDIIIDFFAQHEYFGYPKEDVMFFEQNLLPCFDFNNKVIVESKTTLALAPDGNGGVYRAISTSPLHPPVASSPLEDMTRRGVRHVHIYGVDNVLSLPLDPVFIGGCIQRGVEVGNKVGLSH